MKLEEPINRAGSPDVHMTWANLLFLHWRVDAAAMRELLPRELELDVFDGSAWVGLVPFRMQACDFKGVPRLPGMRDFFECNVRTYATYRGRKGVWFFSLDAQTLLPVLGGRWLWSLNYVYSTFEVSNRNNVIDYRLARRAGLWTAGAMHVKWRVGEARQESAPGSLEEFLTERYWLFTKRWGRFMGGQVRHKKWQLRQAEVLQVEDSLVAAAGLRVEGAPIAWASECLEVEGTKLEEID